MFENHLRSRSILLGLILSVVCLKATGAALPVWPQFRGVNASGLAAEGEEPPVEFGPARNLLWKTAVPSGHSSPCIWGDRLFLTGFVKEKQELRVFCLDRRTGQVLWSKTAPAEKIEKVHAVSNPAASTPATDGERVYVYFGSCGLLCYDFEGELRWTVPLPIIKTTDGHATSPVVLGEWVILNRVQENGLPFIAVDRRTGMLISEQSPSSESKIGQGGQSTPVLWNDWLVIHGTGAIVAYELKNGNNVWSISAPTRGTSTPVVGNNSLFVGAWTNLGEPDLRMKLPNFPALISQYDKDSDQRISLSEFPDDLTAARRPDIGHVEGGLTYVKPFLGWVDNDKNGLIDETEWKGVLAYVLSEQKEHGVMVLRPSGTQGGTAPFIAWQEKTNVPEVPSPLFDEGRVYLINNGGVASCLDANTGKLFYRERLGAAGPYYASPICANGKVFTASGKGVITVFTATDHLQVLARNDLGEPIFATPAVVDNKLYVRTTEAMYAFGK